MLIYQNVIIIYTKRTEDWITTIQTYFDSPDNDIINGGKRFTIEDEETKKKVSVYSKGKIMIQGDKASLNKWVSLIKSLTEMLNNLTVKVSSVEIEKESTHTTLSTILGVTYEVTVNSTETEYVHTSGGGVSKVMENDIQCIKSKESIGDSVQRESIQT